jgi:rod shape determining protein RodA
MSVRTLEPGASTLARAERRIELRLPRGVDPWLALAAAGLGACSVITLHGVGHSYETRQIVYLAVGFVVMLLMSQLDYWRLRPLRWVLYAAMILSILIVLAAGSDVLGSVRAITVGPISFQASELGKVLLIVALAGFVADSSRKTSPKTLTFRVMALVLVPALLVIKEPDLGSGLVYLSIAFGILYIAGVPSRHLLVLAALGVALLLGALVIAPALGVHVLQTYEAQRLTGFLHPSQNPSNYDYQQVQSVIGVGAGGETGRSSAATQTSLGLVGESPTDFIFTVVGERLGFAGAAIVLSLYALMIWRTLRIVANAKNLFAALIAGGAVAMLMFQVFVNVGMTVGIMPITGVTLPLMSYGGSSVLTTFLTLGLLQSIYGRARAANAPKGRVLRF